MLRICRSIRVKSGGYAVNAFSTTMQHEQVLLFVLLRDTRYQVSYIAVLLAHAAAARLIAHAAAAHAAPVRVALTDGKSYAR